MRLHISTAKNGYVIAYDWGAVQPEKIYVAENFETLCRVLAHELGEQVKTFIPPEPAQPVKAIPIQSDSYGLAPIVSHARACEAYEQMAGDMRLEQAPGHYNPLEEIRKAEKVIAEEKPAPEDNKKEADQVKDQPRQVEQGSKTEALTGNAAQAMRFIIDRHLQGEHVRAKFIQQKMGMERSGPLFNLLRKIEDAGFIRRDKISKMDVRIVPLKNVSGGPLPTTLKTEKNENGITKCEPGYARGYREINNGLTAKPTGSMKGAL